jgi:serine/threonine protein kinase
MPAERTCPRCGNALAADAFDGLCPACIGRAAFGKAPVVLDVPGISPDLREPALTPEIEAELARLKPEEAGEWIGPYKLMEQIGQGGFGIVWVADQERPVRRRVALKIIKLGMDTKEVIARFEQERQALAMMDHPHIAKVFDAGATLWGRPFFVMELVRGVKITDYCDQANLPTPDRLALFIQVCNAVQHAHQKGIIHRDLKPSNILVTMHDGVPVPKVIDFGVAKATQQAAHRLDVYTQFQQMIGTPLYMSPEQAEMTRSTSTRAATSTRSACCSTNCSPATRRLSRIRSRARAWMKSAHHPRGRSAAALDADEDARRRGDDDRRETPPHRTREALRRLRGDLDWIVMKCIEKDRSRRYDTANGLAHGSPAASQETKSSSPARRPRLPAEQAHQAEQIGGPRRLHRGDGADRWLCRGGLAGEAGESRSTALCGDAR